ncbi:hypothetical protein Gpo141_00000877 [Globisporangium polare]
MAKLVQVRQQRSDGGRVRRYRRQAPPKDLKRSWWRPDFSSFLTWFASTWVSMLLGIAATLLATAYFVVAMAKSSDSMYDKFAFAPTSATPETVCKTLVIVVATTIIPCTVFTLCQGGSRTAQKVMYFLSGVFLALLVVTNVTGAVQNHKRLALEPQFPAIFNEFYCESRVLRACMDGNQQDMLVLTLGNTSSLSLETKENATESALSVWSRCQQVLLAGMARTSKHEEDGNLLGVKTIKDGKVEHLLDKSKGSHEVDTWCGDLLSHPTPPFSSEDHVRTPSPFAMNPSMWTMYSHELSRSLLYTNTMLGTTVACMVLTALSWRAREAQNRRYSCRS